MQTFVPYPDLRTSCVVLDDRRLGKQRVETYQILRALTWPQYAWKNHPAVRMWRGFVPALVEYGLENCREWTRRGYADAVGPQLLGWTGGEVPVGAPLPPWWGWADLHRSHRSALLRKDPGHYAPLFGALGDGGGPDDLPYLWPPDVFPRWPVRGGPDGLPVEAALRRLGLDEPRPGQRESAEAAAAGRDVLLVVRPGSGGSTAALLAGLATPGRTLWIAPPWGPPAGPVPEVELPAPRVLAAQADRPPPIARPPGPEDLDAMRAEQAEPEFVFRTPATAAPIERQGLVVVDRAGEISDEDGALVPAARGASPTVVVVPRADAAARAGLVRRFGLRTPVHAGGGWDVAAALDVVAPPSPAARRALLAELVREGPALVVTASRDRAERVATGLLGTGLRAAVWAPPPMRAARAAQAVGAWRTRRLDALVVPEGAPPPLGRGRLGLLVDAAGSTPERWRDRTAALAPQRAVLVVDPDSPESARALSSATGCLRAALLEPYGEPVPAPCGRCDRCC